MDDTSTDDVQECSWCERGSGLVLVAGAVALLYIGVDLITGGWLSRAVIGAPPPPAAESVTGTDAGPGAGPGPVPVLEGHAEAGQ